jgi:hypothetical protein
MHVGKFTNSPTAGTTVLLQKPAVSKSTFVKVILDTQLNECRNSISAPHAKMEKKGEKYSYSAVSTRLPTTPTPSTCLSSS